MSTKVRSKLTGFSSVRLALVAGLSLTPWLGASAPPAAAGPGDPGAEAGTTITVSTPLDVVANDGRCSLREAINVANLHLPSGAMPGECPPGSGTDTIVLPAGTYVLTRVGPADDTNVNGDLDVNGSLIIQGAGAATTVIDGNGGVTGERVLHVVVGDVTVSGVTIRKGVQTLTVGGGVYNAGSLTLAGTVVRDNSATLGGGTYSIGPLAVTDSAVFVNTATGGMGGGIYTIGGLQLTNSTVSTNTAAIAGAGGIFAGSVLTVRGSRIFGNTAAGPGGGVYAVAGMMAGDSTFSKNVAGGSGGAAYIATGFLILTRVDVSGNRANGAGANGGGIFAILVPAQPLTLDGVTLRDNTAGTDGGGMYTVGGTPILTGTSVLSNTAGGNGGGMFAVGAGPSVVMKLVDVDLSFNHANFIGGGGYLVGVAVDYDGGTVGHNQTNNGPGGGLFVSGAVPGIGLRLNGVTVNGNTAAGAGNGGGVFSAVTTELRKGVVGGNTAGINGGGLWCSATTTVEDSTIRGNTANGSLGPGDGGGIWCSGNLTVNNTTFNGNDAKGMAGSGGGIMAVNGATLTNMTLSGNHAYGSGGGIYVAGPINIVNSATIAGNKANSDGIGPLDKGGGVFHAGGFLFIRNTLIADNLLASVANDCFRAMGTLTSLDYNLAEAPDPSCVFGAAHDLTGSDPLLLPLADNGGTTQTHDLGAGSPALDRIPNGTNGCGISPLDKDQRGVTRPQPAGGRCDAGAVEHGQSFVYTPALIR
jgi:CSLREA domain-containing protein